MLNVLCKCLLLFYFRSLIPKGELRCAVRFCDSHSLQLQYAAHNDAQASSVSQEEE